MPRILTVLTAQVAMERHAHLKAAYRAAVADERPPGLVRSLLVQDANDREHWRIATLWESREALMAMRSTGTPRGILVFRAAGAEPTLTVLEVAEELPPGT